MNSFLSNVYQKLKGNRLTFKIVMRLKETGIINVIKAVTGENWRKLPTPSEMSNTQAFIDHNKKRIEQMLVLLEDEKSRDVWNSVMRFRSKGTPIPKSLWSDNDQYFVEEIIKFNSDEVFVDGGAYVGDVVQIFLNLLKRRGGSVKKIIAFEPDEENCKILHKNFGKDSRVKIISKGLSNEDKVLLFAAQHGQNSHFLKGNTHEQGVAQDQIIQVPCTSIDSCKDCEEATFIKMDIEGSELDALIGGQETIRKNHPKLAICIYHSLEDMVRIIEYIHNTYPEYKLYVRHHRASICETVLYAVI